MCHFILDEILKIINRNLVIVYTFNSLAVLLITKLTHSSVRIDYLARWHVSSCCKASLSEMTKQVRSGAFMRVLKEMLCREATFKLGLVTLERWWCVREAELRACTVWNEGVVMGRSENPVAKVLEDVCYPATQWCPLHPDPALAPATRSSSLWQTLLFYKHVALSWVI